MNKRNSPCCVNRHCDCRKQKVLEEADEANIEEKPDAKRNLGTEVRPAIVFSIKRIASFAIKVIGQSDTPESDESCGDVDSRQVAEELVLWPVQHVAN